MSTAPSVPARLLAEWCYCARDFSDEHWNYERDIATFAIEWAYAKALAEAPTMETIFTSTQPPTE